MVVRMRHTSSATRQRRSHHALKMGAYSLCSQCKKSVMPHTICQNCGYYKSRQVIDVLAKLDKKERKKKEKELRAREQEQPARDKVLPAKEPLHR